MSSAAAGATAEIGVITPAPTAQSASTKKKPKKRAFGFMAKRTKKPAGSTLLINEGADIGATSI